MRLALFPKSLSSDVVNGNQDQLARRVAFIFSHISHHARSMCGVASPNIWLTPKVATVSLAK